MNNPQQFWRTWTELTDGERFDIVNSSNPPSLREQYQLLWRVTTDGWECQDRSKCNPKEIWDCQ